jgi:hypothetical protein
MSAKTGKGKAEQQTATAAVHKGRVLYVRFAEDLCWSSATVVDFDRVANDAERDLLHRFVGGEITMELNQQCGYSRAVPEDELDAAVRAYMGQGDVESDDDGQERKVKRSKAEESVKRAKADESSKSTNADDHWDTGAPLRDEEDGDRAKRLFNRLKKKGVIVEPSNASKLSVEKYGITEIRFCTDVD